MSPYLCLKCMIFVGQRWWMNVTSARGTGYDGNLLVHLPGVLIWWHYCDGKIYNATHTGILIGGVQVRRAKTHSRTQQPSLLTTAFSSPMPLQHCQHKCKNYINFTKWNFEYSYHLVQEFNSFLKNCL
jgi:hypothetical protein